MGLHGHGDWRGRVHCTRPTGAAEQEHLPSNQRRSPGLATPCLTPPPSSAESRPGRARADQGVTGQNSRAATWCHRSQYGDRPSGGPPDTGHHPLSGRSRVGRDEQCGRHGMGAVSRWAAAAGRAVGALWLCLRAQRCWAAQHGPLWPTLPLAVSRTRCVRRSRCRPGPRRIRGG